MQYNTGVTTSLAAVNSLAQNGWYFLAKFVTLNLNI